MAYPFTKSLEHHGLVAGFCKEINFANITSPGIKPEHINDDALGRCLDTLYEHCVSPLYQNIGEAVVQHLKLPCNLVHLDSTSFH